VPDFIVDIEGFRQFQVHYSQFQSRNTLTPTQFQTPINLMFEHTCSRHDDRVTCSLITSFYVTIIRYLCIIHYLMNEQLLRIRLFIYFTGHKGPFETSVIFSICFFSCLCLRFCFIVLVFYTIWHNMKYSFCFCVEMCSMIPSSYIFPLPKVLSALTWLTIYISGSQSGRYSPLGGGGITELGANR
jgi:hypothetical protein